MTGDTRWLDDEEQRTWRAFLAAQRLLSDRLERQLQREAGLPHGYYEILVRLSEAPGRTLRMSRLATSSLSSRSRLSHAVARMEEAGWIRRRACAEDRRGAFAELTDEGLAILERPETGLVGTPIQESGLFSAERWGEMTAASEQRRKLRSEVDLERGGDIRPVGFSISQLTDAEGTQRGYIVVFQDLSRWRRMQEELRMKDRMAAVGELAAGLAHEIGNPLAAISGSVQMLSSSLQGDPAQRKLLEILLKESQRLDRTIKGFLRFARPRERSSVAFDVARLLAENFELLKNSEEVLPGHQLELALDPPSARLLADPDQMSQIFWNVTRNSLRAMPGGGTLRVVGRLTQDTYCIEFMDTGRGMSEEQRANLFHPFQSFFDGGTGIGMAIVYRIVQDHGGRLHVDSRPGVGTTISVELPADAPGTPGADEPLSQTLSAVPAEVP